jgi:hypothetical protein
VEQHAVTYLSWSNYLCQLFCMLGKDIDGRNHKVTLKMWSVRVQREVVTQTSADSKVVITETPLC